MSVIRFISSVLSMRGSEVHPTNRKLRKIRESVLTGNDQREWREAAAAYAGIVTELNGCLPLARRSGSAHNNVYLRSFVAMT